MPEDAARPQGNCSIPSGRNPPTWPFPRGKKRWRGAPTQGKCAFLSYASMFEDVGNVAFPYTKMYSHHDGAICCPLQQKSIDGIPFSLSKFLLVHVLTMYNNEYFEQM